MDDVVSTTEDYPVLISVLNNDLDCDNDVENSSLEVVSIPEHGTVMVNSDGTITYTPDINYFGPDQFAYRNCDTDGQCDEAVVAITVNAKNDDPVAIDDINNTFLNLAVTGNVLTNDYDLDGDELLPSLLVNPVNGVVVFNSDGTYRYTPNSGYIGEDIFTYQLIDENGGITSAKVFLTVVDDHPTENQAPVANEDILRGQVGIPVSGNVLVNDFDPDGDRLTLNTSLLVSPSVGTLDFQSNGTFTYQAPAAFSGKVSFKYEVCDNAVVSKCNSAYVNIFINAPTLANTTIAADDAYSTKVNGSVSRDVSANDYDPQADEVVYELLSQPKHGTVSFNNNGTFVYQPEADFSGNDQFTYQVCDLHAVPACDRATVYLNISGENNNPIAVDDYFVHNQQDANLLSNDQEPDGDVIVLNTTPLSGPFHGSVQINDDGSFDYSYEEEFYFGPDTFFYQICDDAFPVLCAEAMVVIEPDTDADGVPDSIDLDDDNDGIADAVEMGVLMDDVFDSDEDGIPDQFDTDSDNDSLSDNYESQGANAFRALSGTDTDGDGWDDAYDPDSGGTPIALIDTDEDGIPDFRDDDDDGDGILSVQEDGNSDGNLLNDDCNYNDQPDYLDAELCDVLIPNAFSPNNDGINDFYRVRGLHEYPNARLEVYNRWGVKVYERDKYGNVGEYGEPGAWWDGRDQESGKMLPAGTYLVILVLDNNYVHKGIVYINR